MLQLAEDTKKKGGSFDVDGNLSQQFQDPMYVIDPICAEFWLHVSMSTGFTFDRPTVVLWGRTSGEQTGQHPDHDHSDMAMAQIIDCLGKRIQVVVAGDFRNDMVFEPESLQGVNRGTARIIGKFWEQNNPDIDGSQPRVGAAQIFRKIWEAQDVSDWNGVQLDQNQKHLHVIGKFWEDKNFFKNRLNQVRLFYILEKMIQVHNCGMVHVGMRSGGLDMFGFFGQNIIYLPALLATNG
jgi:hypothetical protein